MKCIIFGSKGYLGSNFCKYLNNVNSEIFLPDYKSGERLDLTQYKNLKGINWNVDSVFVLAGKTGTQLSFDDYYNFLISNELILLNILNAIKDSKYRPRIVFPSTRLVYKGSDSLLNENSLKESRTVYAVNKLSCENYLKAYSIRYEIPYTIMRICVPYGNMVSSDYSFGTIGNFISKASKDKITLYGDGDIKRTFTHINDLCRILKIASISQKTINHIFNMPGEEFKLKEVAYMIADKFSSNVEFIDWPKNEYLIESGSTVFETSYLKSLIDIDIEHKFLDWVKGI